MTVYNPNPTNLKQDCCDGGAFLGTGTAEFKRLFLNNTHLEWSGDLQIQAAQTFVSGELVKIDTATGAITKLTVAPTVNDVLALVMYGLNSTASAISAGKGQTRASVVVEADGINQDALILPSGVTFNDAIKAALIRSNLITTKLL